MYIIKEYSEKNEHLQIKEMIMQQEHRQTRNRDFTELQLVNKHIKWANDMNREFTEE